MKKKNFLLHLAKRCTLGVIVLGAVLAAYPLTSCDNRNIHQVVKEMANAEVDTVGWPSGVLRTNPFSSVEINCFADVTYHQTAMGDDHYVEVKAPGNVLENVDVVVEDGELQVRVDRRYRMPEKAVAVVNIYAPFVNRFTLIGGKCLRMGKVMLTSPLELLVDGNVGTLTSDSIVAHEVSMLLDGSGSFDLKGIETGDVRVKLKGNGTICLSGKCQGTKMNLLGDGVIDLQGLACDSIIKEEIQGKGRILRK